MLDEINQLLEAEPFVPFAFVLTSGDRYRVDNPGLAFVAENLIFVHHPRSDRRDILRLNQLVAIEVLEPIA